MIILEMLARLRAGQRYGRRRQADDVGSFMTWGIPWLLSLAHAKFSEGG